MPANMVLVGWVIAPVGLDGAVRVQVTSDAPHRFVGGSTMYAGDSLVQVEYSRPSKRRLVVKYRGIDSREAAAALRDTALYVHETEAPPLAKDTYYHFQLIGMQVVDTNGDPVGLIEQVIETRANDVYVVSQNGEEVLIPAVADFIKEVNVAEGWMAVELPQAI